MLWLSYGNPPDGALQSSPSKTGRFKEIYPFLAAKALRIQRPAASAGLSRCIHLRFRSAIYVLHAFQKKSMKGIATPRKDMKLILERLAAAERDFQERHNRDAEEKAKNPC
jgi:hypothetical protein